MKKLLKMSGFIIILLLTFLIHACKKEKPAPPVITTTVVTEISYTTAVSGGEVISEGGAPIVSRGICWNTSAYPTISNSIKVETGTLGSFSSNLNQLIPNTTYFVSAYATNSGGTGYGDQVAFKTSPAEIPVLKTSDISSVTQTSAISGGNITDDMGGTITERGICWGTTENPTTSGNKTSDGTGTGIFTHLLTGLISNTTYYVRAYAINNIGTSYGNEMILKTYTGTVTDIDGNNYNTVTISDQVWMAENLKTTKFKDGNVIPSVNDNIAWSTLTTPGYSWYNNDPANKNIYGALYNWYTVNTGILCPTNWHVPSDTEWATLINFLGGNSIAGGKLKETGTMHWNSPNTGATNETGFTALPGGERDYDGTFPNVVKNYGGWWSSTENLPFPNAWVWDMFYGGPDVQRGYSAKEYGFSVRCIKD